jgi:hypothetical protein
MRTTRKRQSWMRSWATQMLDGQRCWSAAGRKRERLRTLRFATYRLKDKTFLSGRFGGYVLQDERQLCLRDEQHGHRMWFCLRILPNLSNPSFQKA